MDYEEGGIERRDTAFRMLYSLLFALVISVLETVVGALVIFQLLYTMITKQEPSRRVSDLGNRLVTYFYRMLRYLTYNSDDLPFPFSDFPEALEAPYAEAAAEADATPNEDTA
jgi:hypothetical protein